MTSEDGRYSLVFNGVIYNYKEIREALAKEGVTFRSHSDTEVLLKSFMAWGLDGLNRYYGMFAFCVLDREKQVLTLVRDRFGVKPLYYANDGQSFAFASTASEIANHFDMVPSLEYIGRGIRQKYYEDETDIAPYTDLLSVPPAHYVTVSLDSLETNVHRYYDLDSVATTLRGDLPKQSFEETKKQLFGLLTDASRLRLRADVPIGISLSGGVDSTAIAAICANAGVKLTAFSFGDLNDPSSEAELVQQLSSDYGLDVHYVNVAGEKAISKLFFDTLRAQQAPFPHTSQMAQYAVFEAAKIAGIKVMLGGQGGDEAFMGYRKFYLFEMINILAQRRWTAFPKFLTNLAQIVPAVSSRALVFVRESGRYFGNATGMPSGLALPELVATPSPGEGKGAPTWMRQSLDITRYSLPTLLRYEDRNSMANSIESRLPFLDHRVLEFGLALPTHWKLNKGFGKFILREAMQGLVPDSILWNRDKRGFDTRHGDIIRSGLGNTLRLAMKLHENAVKKWIPHDAKIDDYFSDEEIISNASRFAEATSLIWLADPTLKSYPAY